MRLLLFGNPNVGKTSLFNRMTGKKATVGNRPGVTVESGRAAFVYAGRHYEVTDVPGTYSLRPDSEDGRVASHALEGDYDCIYAVMDMTALLRGLSLFSELSALHKPIIVVLTFLDEAMRRGITVDLTRLSKILDAPVYAVSAKNGQGMDRLLSASPPPPPRRLTLSPRQIVSATLKADKKPVRERSDKIDLLLTDRRFALPFFLLVMAAVFFIVFGPVGGFLSDLLHSLLFDSIYGGLSSLLAGMGTAPPLQSFFLDGVYGGVSEVLSFLPQIALLFLLLTALEESGYMARVAYILTPYTAALGLDGRAAISFLLGFGCTVPAVMSARTMENTREQKKTVFLLPFLSCSARATVYGAFIPALFPEYGFFVGLFLYLLGFLAVFLTSRLLLLRFPSGSEHFFLEFPPYRRPSARALLSAVGRQSAAFLKKAGSVILLVSAAFWLLGNLTPDFRYSLGFSDSILFMLGSALAPLFRPLGFGTPEAVAALLSGLGAKEAVLSVIGIVCPGKSLFSAVSSLFTPASGIAFLVFLSLSFPCAATLAAVRGELRRRRSFLFFLFYILAVAYLFSLLTYHALLLLA